MRVPAPLDRKASPGYSTLEFAGVLVLVLTLIVGLMQVVVYVHARDVVKAAVQEGARVASSEGRSTKDGAAQAQALLEAGLGRSGERFRVVGIDEEDRVVMRARGSFPFSLPGVSASIPLAVETSMEKERFEPYQGEASP